MSIGAQLVSLVALALTLGLGACNDSGSSLGGTCKEDKDCKPKLSCNSEGEELGQCTATCQDSAVCQQEFGKWGVCVGGFCALQCGKDAECPERVGCTEVGICRLR